MKLSTGVLALFVAVASIADSNAAHLHRSSRLHSLAKRYTDVAGKVSSILSNTASKVHTHGPASGSKGHYVSNSSSLYSIGYYQDGSSNILPPEKIPFDKLTHVFYAFATSSKDLSIGGFTPATLKRTVTAVHGAGLPISLSLGGWDGGVYFSQMVGSASARTKFVKQVTDLINTYNLDGIDMDWEFPNDVNGYCNIRNKKDSANLLAFYKQLRSAIGSNKLITAPVTITPYADETGNPMKDVSEFAKYLDFISIMAYDLMGTWESAFGGMSALYNNKAPADTAASGDYAVKQWTAAKFPASQIVLGVPLYGWAGKVLSTPTASKPGVKISKTQIKGDKDDTKGTECGVTSYSGEFAWRHLFDQNVMSTIMKPASGWVRSWDSVAMVPFVYNSKTQTVISYDDSESIGKKVDYIKTNGMKGMMYWALDQIAGLPDTQNILSCAAKGLGIKH